MCWKHHATTLNFCETKPKGRLKGPQSKLVEAKTHQIKGRECAERSFNFCETKPTADRDGHIETGGRGENGMVVALGENSIQYTDRPTARISRHSSRIFLPRIIAISLEDGCDPPR